MGEAKYMVGWPASRPEVTTKDSPAGSIQPARISFLKNLAGGLACQPCIWIPPYICDVFTYVVDLWVYYVYFVYSPTIYLFFANYLLIILLWFVQPRVTRPANFQ